MAVSVCIGVMALLAAACVPSASLLSEVRLSRPAVSPDGTGSVLAADLHYRLGQSAQVSVFLELGEGNRIYLRQDEPRPVAGDYVYRFDGTYPLPSDSGQRRVLEDGRYELVVEARSASGGVAAADATVEVVNADVRPPGILDLRAQPETITPNFDGYDDLAQVSYRLDKEAQVDHWVQEVGGTKRWIGPSQRRGPGEYVLSWNGLEHNRPLPDGTYQFVVRAVDLAGNVTIEQLSINVVHSGVPVARVLEVTFSPRRLMVGDLVRVEVRIRNEGEMTLLTQGPDPGYVYSSYDNYFSIEDSSLVDRAGRWRIGVDWAGSPGTVGGKYPYRWGLGQDLEPGEEVTVEGYVRIEHEDQRAFLGDHPDYHRMWFFAGLVQEGVAIHQDGVGGTEIEVSF